MILPHLSVKYFKKIERPHDTLYLCFHTKLSINVLLILCVDVFIKRHLLCIRYNKWIAIKHSLYLSINANALGCSSMFYMVYIFYRSILIYIPSSLSNSVYCVLCQK